MPKRKKIKLANIGTRIRAWRKAAPMKVVELAKLLCISQGTLSDIENNKSRPSAETIVAFQEYTNIDIIWMLTGKTGDNRGKSVMRRGKKTRQ